MNKEFGYKWRSQLREEDEISDAEDGFMMGYDHAYD